MEENEEFDNEKLKKIINKSKDLMKDYLSREHNGIEHIVSDERKN